MPLPACANIQSAVLKSLASSIPSLQKLSEILLVISDSEKTDHENYLPSTPDHTPPSPITSDRTSLSDTSIHDPLYIPPAPDIPFAKFTSTLEFSLLPDVRRAAFHTLDKVLYNGFCTDVSFQTGQTGWSCSISRIPKSTYIDSSSPFSHSRLYNYPHNLPHYLTNTHDEPLSLYAHGREYRSPVQMQSGDIYLRYVLWSDTDSSQKVYLSRITLNLDHLLPWTRTFTLQPSGLEVEYPPPAIAWYMRKLLYAADQFSNDPNKKFSLYLEPKYGKTGELLGKEIVCRTTNLRTCFFHKDQMCWQFSSPSIYSPKGWFATVSPSHFSSSPSRSRSGKKYFSSRIKFVVPKPSTSVSAGGGGNGDNGAEGGVKKWTVVLRQGVGEYRLPGIEEGVEEGY